MSRPVLTGVCGALLLLGLVLTGWGGYSLLGFEYEYTEVDLYLVLGGVAFTLLWWLGSLLCQLTPLRPPRLGYGVFFLGGLVVGAGLSMLLADFPGFTPRNSVFLWLGVGIVAVILRKLILLRPPRPRYEMICLGGLVAGAGLSMLWADPPGYTPRNSVFLWLGVGIVAVILRKLILLRPPRPRYEMICLGGLVAGAGLSMLWADPPGYTPRDPSFLCLGLGIVALTGAAVAHIGWLAVGGPGLRAALREASALKGAACAVVALVVLGEILLLAYSPERVSVAQPPTSAPPALGGQANEVAWRKTLKEYVSDQAAGSRGLLLAVSDGVLALDPDSGDVLWERRRTDVGPCRIEYRAAPLGPQPPESWYLEVSPDRSLVAYYVGCEQPLLEVVDTATGEVRLQMRTESPAALQLTNEVLWANGKGIRISDLETLWESRRSAALTSATASQFISDINCTGDWRVVEVCQLVLLNDLDGSESAKVERVVARESLPFDHVDGWVVQLAPGASPDVPEGVDVAMQALHLETGETVPLGDFRSVHYVSKTRLVLQRADGSVAVFDPATRELAETGVTRDPGFVEPHAQWPTADVWRLSWKDTRTLVVERQGDPVRIPVELPAGAVIHVELPMGSVGEAEVALRSVPGCVMALAKVSGAGGQNWTQLACLR